MIKGKYIYDQSDLTKNKSLYQYSRFGGKKFLNDFFSSRKKFLKKVIKNKSNIENINEVTFNKKEILNQCMFFERKKKIFLDIRQKREFNFSDYVNLSYKISNYLLKEVDYSILSTFLKINDFLSYKYSKKKDHSSEELLSALIAENLILKKLIDEKI